MTYAQQILQLLKLREDEWEQEQYMDRRPEGPFTPSRNTAANYQTSTPQPMQSQQPSSLSPKPQTQQPLPSSVQSPKDNQVIQHRDRLKGALNYE